MDRPFEIGVNWFLTTCFAMWGFCVMELYRLIIDMLSERSNSAAFRWEIFPSKHWLCLQWLLITFLEIVNNVQLGESLTLHFVHIGPRNDWTMKWEELLLVTWVETVLIVLRLVLHSVEIWSALRDIDMMILLMKRMYGCDDVMVGLIMKGISLVKINENGWRRKWENRHLHMVRIANTAIMAGLIPKKAFSDRYNTPN